MGMGILGWIALTSDDYEKALNCANECLQIAYTPQERMNALGVKGAALALLKEIRRRTNRIIRCTKPVRLS